MNKKIKALCEAAIMIALALILNLLKDVLPGQLPNGGSLLNVSMVPIVFFAVRYGAGWGAMAGFVFGGQLAFVSSVNNDAVLTFIVSKLVGGLVSVIIAILVSPPYDPQSVEEELAAARERN